MKEIKSKKRKKETNIKVHPEMCWTQQTQTGLRSGVFLMIMGLKIVIG